MKVAGFWIRVKVNTIDLLILILTLGIYGQVMLILWLLGKPNIGMRAANLDYSDKTKQLDLWWFTTLGIILILVTAGIGAIVQLVFVCRKKGTFGEIWSKNFTIMANK